MISFCDKAPRLVADPNAGGLCFHKAFGRVSLYFLEDRIENVG